MPFKEETHKSLGVKSLIVESNPSLYDIREALALSYSTDDTKWFDNDWLDSRNRLDSRELYDES